MVSIRLYHSFAPYESNWSETNRNRLKFILDEFKLPQVHLRRISMNSDYFDWIYTVVAVGMCYDLNVAKLAGVVSNESGWTEIVY